MVKIWYIGAISQKIFREGDFLDFLCFFNTASSACRPSDSIVSEDAEIELGTLPNEGSVICRWRIRKLRRRLSRPPARRRQLRRRRRRARFSQRKWELADTCSLLFFLILVNSFNANGFVIFSLYLSSHLNGDSFVESLRCYKRTFTNQIFLASYYFVTRFGAKLRENRTQKWHLWYVSQNCASFLRNPGSNYYFRALRGLVLGDNIFPYFMW